MASDRHIALGMVFHNHQPVGNDEAVIEKIHDEVYEPLVAALERHPGVAAGLHYTGSLLDWLVRVKPDYVSRVRVLVERGQAEVLSGGYYEPILPSIPDDDKHAQISKLNDAVRHHFGHNPTGMWLAERVWEPTLPTHLCHAGIEWTILDDVHFKMVGLGDEDLTGYFVTEDNGNPLRVFATSKQLRFTTPWRPVQETIDYLRSEATPGEDKILVMADDGEKFGAWPGTYELCWGTNGQNGWIDEFFTAIDENAGWLHTVRMGDWIRNARAAGRIYLPTASYGEMMEWALPAHLSHEYSHIAGQLEQANHPALRFMRGGFWRNFMVKYPEINLQHKKMLRVHDKVKQAHREADPSHDSQRLLGEAHEDLLRSQSNDTYWHGLFGGIYMTDVRTQVQAHMCRAQQAAELILYGAAPWLRHEITDFDRDSLEELLLEGSAANIYIDLADGGSIFWWDLRNHNYNLASTVSRRPEGYHEMLREFEEKKRAGLISADPQAIQPQERVLVKEQGLDKYLFYDWYSRNSMIDHFLGPGTTLEGFMASDYNEEGDFVQGAYRAELEPVAGRALHVLLERDGTVHTGGAAVPVRVSKRLTLVPGSPDVRVLYTIQNLGHSELTGVFGSEWNINLLGGGHNPSAYYRVKGAELQDAALDSTGEVRNVRSMALGNSWLGIEMGLTANHEATLWRFPIQTISGSEAGFERTYQASCILLQWLLKLAPSDSVDIELTWTYQGNAK